VIKKTHLAIVVSHIIAVVAGFGFARLLADAPIQMRAQRVLQVHVPRMACPAAETRTAHSVPLAELEPR
jgi:hypothetical protein